MIQAHIVCENTHSVLLNINGRQEWVSRKNIQKKIIDNQIELSEHTANRLCNSRHRTVNLVDLVDELRFNDPLRITPKPNRPHQQQAFEKLRQMSRFALVMQMRMGKTKVAIDLLCNHFANGRIERVLWLCPNSAIETAKEQWQKFAVLDVPRKIVALETISGCGQKRFNDIDAWFDDRCAVIIDESQMIKNDSAKRSKRMKQWFEIAGVVGILSGTPITQNVQDLYNQVRALDWRIFGYRNMNQFKRNHLIMSEKYIGLIHDVRNTQYLSERLQPFVYECFVDFSQRQQRQIVKVEMSERQRQLYDEIKDEILARLGNFTERTSDVYLLFTALQSVLSGYVSAQVMKQVFGEHRAFGMTLSAPKLGELVKCVNALDEQVVIWCTRRHELHSIVNVLPNTIAVSGEMDALERHQRIQQFRKSKTGVLVAMVQVAKRAIEMSECNQVMYYGHSFDYESREQSKWRTLLPEKTLICTYTDLVYANSLDERILLSHSKKRSIIKAFLDLLKQDRQQALKQMEQL